METGLDLWNTTHGRAGVVSRNLQAKLTLKNTGLYPHLARHSEWQHEGLLWMGLMQS
jgi:hypothetical protein